MAYSDDVMIVLLQKCLLASRQGPPPYNIEIENENEESCYEIAINKKYIDLVRGNEFNRFTSNGQIALNNLVEAKKQNEIKQERHLLEQERLALEIKRDAREIRLFWVAICSLLIAFGALVISAIALCRPAVVKFDSRGIPFTITTQKDRQNDSGESESTGNQKQNERRNRTGHFVDPFTHPVDTSVEEINNLISR
ncbi:MAG: hypothetical protein FWH27_12035 [Planctomycetaceae bacterium]|nr:hypothetical protein [Planctomycetaceae bacterium]